MSRKTKKATQQQQHSERQASGNEHHQQPIVLFPTCLWQLAMVSLQLPVCGQQLVTSILLLPPWFWQLQQPLLPSGLLLAERLRAVLLLLQGVLPLLLFAVCRAAF